MLNELTTKAKVSLNALDTRVPPVVRVINGALYDDEDSSAGIVLTGRIDPNTLRFIKVDSSYQRPLMDRTDLFDALKSGAVFPAIEIGVRGQDFDLVDGDYIINSPAYVIDGWQRVGTALRLLELIPGHEVNMLGVFHFDTNNLWERHRFTDLNRNIRKVSSNLHLRNTRDGNEAIECLYKLSNSALNFAVHKRVCWSQNMHREDLVTAMMLARISRRLHGHLSGLNSARLGDIASSLNVVVQKIGADQFRRNIITFFDVVEECWGIKNVEYRKAAPQLKQTFLGTLARLFSIHDDFWNTAGTVFFVPANLRHKLAKFPIQDPHIRNLCGLSGSASNILYEMLIKHINSGKRTGHLRERAGVIGKGSTV